MTLTFCLTQPVPGMLYRERHGVGNIGWESAAIPGLCALSVPVLFAP